MKLLWLCNMMPGVVKAAVTGKSGGGGLWVDHMLQDLMQLDMEIRILCPGSGQSGKVNTMCSYATFVRCAAYAYPGELETVFRKELQNFQPDVIHIWGTEYGHTLAMANAAEAENCLDRTVASIQGLCSIYAGHYAEGVPEKIQKRYTLRDLLRRDNIRQQQKKFALRGQMEVKALQKLRHVIGRTQWDKACTRQINPGAKYHFCNETLRSCFYEDGWRYESCIRHRIFASSLAYPVKGFHYLLEAMGQIVKQYPDATIAVPGRSFLPENARARLRQNSYEAYLEKLAKQYGLEGKIEFLGSLSAEAMKAEYCKANVFVMPSTIENSPNSLGEAMLLGVPCVAADVGGVADLMDHRQEGYVYQPSAAYMLANYVTQVFDMEEQAALLGSAACQHARRTHDPEKNLRDLLNIYEKLAKEAQP